MALARTTWSASSVACPMKGSAPFRGSRFAAIQSRARAWKVSRSSITQASGIAALPCADSARCHPVPVLSGVTVDLPVQHGPPKIQVYVVFPGHADPAVHLDAVLDQLGAAIAH